MARKSKELTGKTYESLLDAAIEVFSQKGYSCSTFHEIAERAGFTRGAIYWHFKDKEELLDAVLQRDVLPWSNLPEKFSSLQCAPTVAELCIALESGLDEVIASSRLQRVIRILFYCAEPVMEKQQAYLHFTAVFERVKNYVVAALSTRYYDAGGTPHPNIEVAAASVKALLTGALYGWLLNKSSIDLRQVSTAAEKLILSFINGSHHERGLQSSAALDGACKRYVQLRHPIP